MKPQIDLEQRAEEIVKECRFPPLNYDSDKKLKIWIVGILRQTQEEAYWEGQTLGASRDFFVQKARVEGKKEGLEEAAHIADDAISLEATTPVARYIRDEIKALNEKG